MTYATKIVLVTIFTGHTLDLTNIEVISPIQTASGPFGTDGSYRSLFIEIHLKSGNCLKYNFFTKKYPSKPNENDLKEYREAIANFKTQRFALLEQWAIAVAGTLAKEGVES
ncbi:hypothetical protein [Runella sp.]|uniref:hypothetical protein n=1 Tax=Runella sp. TaxID=1960881 RepID=UPI003D0DC6F8